MIETAVLISIKPKWVKLILSGQKTIEVRKTVPKLTPPLTCYIYESGTGCVVGEFVYDSYTYFLNTYGRYVGRKDTPEKSCLSEKELLDYVGENEVGFEWRISSVVEYDEPLPLSAFCDMGGNQIKKPPQSWRYVRRNENEHHLHGENDF